MLLICKNCIVCTQRNWYKS